MGAFWHLFIPVQIKITMSQNQAEAIPSGQSALPETFAMDYLEMKREVWSTENKVLGTLHNVNLTYLFSDKMMGEIKPFLEAAWHFIASESDRRTELGLHEFIENVLPTLDISSKSLNSIDDQLQQIPDNYYLYYDVVPDMVVYHGWPDALRADHWRCALGGLTFLHSHEKINLYPEETVLFYNLREQIRTQFAGKYAIAKYLQVMGY